MLLTLFVTQPLPLPQDRTMSRGYVDPNFPNPNGPQDATIVIYGYTPSLALAVVGAVSFALLTCIHTGQTLRAKSWYFCILVLGAAMEVVGYIFRALSSRKDPYNVIYFVVQYFFIVCAPVFLSAAIYVVLSRFIQLAGRSFAPLPPRVIITVFVILDVVTTGIQVAGAALIGSAESDHKDSSTANNILLAGLAIQVFSFAVFLALLCVTVSRVAQHKDCMAWAKSRSAICVLVALVVTSLLVELRTVFRLIETAQGVFGYLSTHEAYFGCLEYLPIILAVGTWNLFHPGRLMPRGLQLTAISSQAGAASQTAV